jgi:IclR family mhp operon transcriptional activator
MGGYQVTGQAAILSSGFHGAPLAIEAARPWAIDLTRRLKWPTGICTLQDDGVIVRYSTIVDSPISPFHSTIGVKLSLGRRALGLAYLAFCPEDERALLMEIMRNSSDPENHFKTPRRLDEIIEQTRRNGYAQRDRDVAPRSSDTLAMPLRLGERVLATFGVTYFRSALRPSDLEDALVEPLRATVETIERELEVMAKIPASGIA